MKNNEEYKNVIEDAFKVALKNQIKMNKRIFVGGNYIAIESIGNISATLQIMPSLMSLLSGEDINLHFIGNIELGNISENIQSMVTHHYEATSITTKFLSVKNEFVFNDNIAISLLD